MTATATRLVQQKFPVSPLGGTLGSGLQWVDWAPSEPVWNKTTGEIINDPVSAQVDPVYGRMGWRDDTRSNAVGVPLACCDDPNNTSQDWVWIMTLHVAGQPTTELRFKVLLATPDPCFVANLVPVASNPVVTGLVTVTSSTLTVTYPAPGTVNIEDTGGGGGGSGTVTSVGMTGDGTVFNATVPGSPVTTSGAFAPTLHTQAANTGFFGPTTGSAAAPTFRAIVPADLPATYATAAALATEASTARAAESANATAITNEASTARAAESANATAITTETTARTAADITSRRETVNFTATGAAWHTAEDAETWDSVGTLAGTFTYAKSVAATPDTFNSTSLPVVLAAGDTLQITCTALRTGPPARGIFRMRRTA